VQLLQKTENLVVHRYVYLQESMRKKSERFNQLKRKFEQKDDTGKHYFIFIKISESL